MLAKIEGCLSEFASFWGCAKLAWRKRALFLGGRLGQNVNFGKGMAQHRGGPGGMRRVGGEGREGRLGLVGLVAGPTRQHPCQAGLVRGAAD